MIFSPPEAIEIAERFTRAFPELQASWYIMGSHASGDAIDLSDVDLAAICRPLPVDALELGRRLQLPYDGKVDLWLKHPDWINRFPDAQILPMLNHAILLKGNELRPGLPEVDLDAYKESIAAGFGQALEHFHRDRRVEVPPEASDEFLGYVDRAPSWARLERWTHGIVVLIGKAAGAVAACEGRTAGSREEALAQFSSCKDVGEWPEWSHRCVALLRGSWRYRVPDTLEDRRELRKICEAVHGLEELTVDRLTEAGLTLFRVNR